MKCLSENEHTCVSALLVVSPLKEERGVRGVEGGGDPPPGSDEVAEGKSFI